MKKTMGEKQMIKNVQGKIWAIQPDLLKNSQNGRVLDAKTEIEEAQARFNSFDTIKGGSTLVIPVSGVLEPSMSIMSFLFGGTSTVALHNEIKKAISDSSIDRIILEFNTPGGDITGIQSLANTIYKARGNKEIIAMVKDLSASAGYWLASACSSIVLSSKTAMVGSIGVVMVHTDISKMDENAGVKVTEVYAGKYKRLISNHKPLSEDGKNDLQKKVDYLYGIFVKDVVKYRNRDEDFVINNMADGKMFIGEQAIKSDLVDHIDFTDNLYISNITKGDRYMSDAKIEAKKPADISEIFDEKAFLKGKKIGIEAGVLEERERILAIQGLSTRGYENIISTAIKNGYSVEKTGFELWKEKKERGVSADELMQENVSVAFTPSEENTSDEEKKKQEEDKLVGMMVGDKKKDKKKENE